MDDGSLTAVDVHGTIQATIVSTTHLVEEARNRHKLSFTAAAALGRALTGASLVLPVVAKRGRLTLKFQGDGPLGKVVVDASAKGVVTGYVANPRLELPPNSLGNLDVGRAIGSRGYLHVTVDTGFGPHTSTVELASGEVGEDLNKYLVSCQDTGSILIVGVHISRQGVEAAGGLLIQLLPDHTEETICMIENNLASFGTFTFLMRRGMALEDILKRGLQGFELRDLSPMQPLRFDCRCSSERFLQALRGMAKHDLIEMAQQGEAEGRCQFCNAVYHVPGERLIDIARGSG